MIKKTNSENIKGDKMKLLILTVLSLLFLITCARNQKMASDYQGKCMMKKCENEKLQGDAFNKHCTMPVSDDDINVEGDRECKLKHDGKIFYFSSRKKMEEFEEELKENVSDEDEIWSVMGRP
jgi:YHS domain-containing protein